MNDAVIGIGSNIQPHLYIPRAVQIIQAHCRLIAQSAWVETEPVGFKNQPSFVNGAVRIETSHSRDEMSSWLKSVEQRLDRVRTANKFGPRTIDLDVVVWNGDIVDSDVYRRDFLKHSVLEVWPDLYL